MAQEFGTVADHHGPICHRCIGQSGIAREIGWWPVKDKVLAMKMTYGRRFEWEGEGGWGRRCWLDVKERADGCYWAGWWRQIERLAEEYDINMEHPCISLQQWKAYVKTRVAAYMQRNWLQVVSESRTLEVLLFKHEPKWEPYIDGSWGGKCLFKL